MGDQDQHLLIETNCTFPHSNSQAAKSKNGRKKQGVSKELEEIFGKVHLNIPALELIQTVPPYAKFLRDLCSTRKRFNDYGKVELREEMSSIITKGKVPAESFRMTCTIGGVTFDGALMDIGVVINFMPLSTCRKLGIDHLHPTSISLKLADGSARKPIGIVEDVLLKIDKFILPADFVVVEMEEDLHNEQEPPIILGRPFLAAAGAKINVQKGTLSMKVMGEKRVFPLFTPSHTPEQIHEVFVLNEVKCKGNEAKRERVFGAIDSFSTSCSSQKQDVYIPPIPTYSPPWESDSEDERIFDEPNIEVANAMHNAKLERLRIKDEERRQKGLLPTPVPLLSGFKMEENKNEKVMSLKGTPGKRKTKKASRAFEWKPSSSPGGSGKKTPH